MKPKALKQAIEEIQHMERLANIFYKSRKYEVLHPSFSFLRYLINKFKIQCYHFLKDNDKNLGNYLPIENLIFLVRIPFKEKNKPEGLHIYPMLDQIKRIDVVFPKESKQISNGWVGRNYKGLAWDIIQTIGKNGKSPGSIFTVNHFWYVSSAYTPLYKEEKIANKNTFDVELPIYGVKKGEPSTAIFMAMENVELALVGTGEIPPETVKRAYDLFQIVKDGFLLVLNKLWYLMFYDKELWIETYLQNSVSFGPFLKTQNAVFNKINYYLNISSQITIEKLDNELIKHFAVLIGELEKIDEKLSQFKKMYISFEIAASPHFNYDDPFCYSILKYAADRNALAALRALCRENSEFLWGDLSNFPEMVKHDFIHSQNMEKIAIPWCVTVSKREVFSRVLLEAIWLHDIGLNRYAGDFRPEGAPDKDMESRLRLRKIHWLLGADRIKEVVDKLFPNMPPERIPLLEILVKYHSKSAPLTGRVKKVKHENQSFKIEPLLQIAERNFPYFTTIAMLRCIDAIDVQRNRCVWSNQQPFKRWIQLRNTAKPLQRTYKKYKEFVEKQVLHFLKHGSFLNIVVHTGEGNSKIEYLPDLLSPAFLIFYAYAEAIMDLEKELTKINNSSVLRKIREEMSVGQRKNISLGILATDNGIFKANYSLWGVNVNFTDREQNELLMHSFDELCASYQFEIGPAT